MGIWKRKQPSTPPPPPPEPSSRENTSTEFLSGDSQRDRRSLEVLLEAIAKVSESRDLEVLLDFVVDRSIEVTESERGLLVLLDDDGNQSVRVARSRGGPIEGEVKYTTSVVKRVLEDDTPIRSIVNTDEEALQLGTSVFDLKLRAVMCVPLSPEDRTSSLVERGVLYVDSKAATREFKDSDLSMFFALAKHIAIALENARLHFQQLEKAKLEQSLEIATEIQSGLMPKTPHSIPGLDVFGWFLPAEHASGDFYDFVETKSGRLAVVVGDVTGHGIGPALITATCQASLRAYVNVLEEPGAVVTQLNRDLADRMDDGMFITLFLALFDSEGTMQVVNAGGTPPLVWRHATSTIESIAGTGPAIGMMDGFVYDAGDEVRLEEGDALVAFTDGLVEARHPSYSERLFDESGMRAVLSDLAGTGCSAQGLTQKVVANVLEFAGGVREDDMTIVVVRRVSGK